MIRSFFGKSINPSVISLWWHSEDKPLHYSYLTVWFTGYKDSCNQQEKPGKDPARAPLTGPDYSLTTMTGAFAARTTLSVTLPIRCLNTPLVPWEPIMIRSLPVLSCSSMITSAGVPLFRS